MREKKQRRIDWGWVVLILVLALAWFLMWVLCDYLPTRDIRVAYNKGTKLIQQGEYAEARDVLYKIAYDSDAPDGVEDMISLCYAYEDYEDGDIYGAYWKFYDISIYNLPKKIRSQAESFGETLSEEYAAYQYSRKLASGVPFVGMLESDIANTSLGEPSPDVRVSVSGDDDEYTSTDYDFLDGDEVIFTARCVGGEVTQVWDYREEEDDEPEPTSTPAPTATAKASSTSGSNSLYNYLEKYHAEDYDDPEYFYEDHYDDFESYEDALHVWERAH